MDVGWTWKSELGKTGEKFSENFSNFPINDIQLIDLNYGLVKLRAVMCTNFTFLRMFNNLAWS